MRTRILLAIPLCVALACAALAQTSSTNSTTSSSCRFQSISVGGTPSFALGINDHGSIVGGFVSSNVEKGFLVSNGTVKKIVFPGAAATVANGISRSGVIVGNYTTNTSRPTKGFAFANGKYVSISVPGSIQTSANGVNSNGVIVGEYRDSHQNMHGFILKSGRFTTVNHPNSVSTVLTHIAENGDISGNFANNNGQRGFLLKSGHFTTVAFPAAIETDANGLNASDVIVGFFQPQPETADRGFVLKNGKYHVVNKPGTSTTLWDVNDANVIVGAFSDSTGFNHAVAAFGCVP